MRGGETERRHVCISTTHASLVRCTWILLPATQWFGSHNGTMPTGIACRQGTREIVAKPLMHAENCPNLCGLEGREYAGQYTQWLGLKMASWFKARHPRNIPAGYHKPIGQLVVRWNFTELYLQSVIWHIWHIKDPKVARLLTWDLNTVSKVELFKHLVPRWITDPAHQRELKAIANDVESLRQKRNRVAHGTWGYKPGERKKFRQFQIKRDTRILPKAELVSVADLKQWAEDIDKLNVRLAKFHRKLRAPLP